MNKLILSLLAFGILFVSFARIAPVNANPNHWEDTSSCKQIACDSSEGQKDQVCVKGGGGSNCHPESWNCPKDSIEFRNKCYKDFHEVDKVHTEADTQTVSCTVPEEEVKACEVPVEPTPQPTVPFSAPAEAFAPTQPLCPTIQAWIPTVWYHGMTRDAAGNAVFHYTWSTVDPNVHTYIVWYGFTPNNLIYPLIVNGEGADITMYGGNTNFMKVAGYVNPGCSGMFSATVN